MTAARRLERPQGRDQWNAWRMHYVTVAAHGSRYGVSRARRLYDRSSFGGDDKARARYWGVSYEDIDRAKVYERDGWRCGICRKPINRRATQSNPMRVSLDHILPMSLGGPHVYVNVQAAHLRCNLEKSWTGCGDQLMLMHC
jgi:hypothetical protein